MHGFRAVLLGKDVGADGLTGLFKAEFPKQCDNFRINVYCSDLSTFRCVEVDTLLRGVAQVPGYRDRVRLEVDIFLLETAALALPDAGVDEKTEQDTLFERFIFQRSKDPLNIFGGVRLHILFLKFALAWSGPPHFIHGIDCDHIAHVCHFEQAVQMA